MSRLFTGTAGGTPAVPVNAVDAAGKSRRVLIQRYNHPSMFSKFQRRSSKLEHLDLGDYTAEEYEGCLAELQQVNRWLGDARALRTTLLRTIREWQLTTFSV